MKVSIPVGLLILLTWVSAQAQVSSLPAPQVGYVMAQGSVTVQVMKTGLTPQLAPSDHLREAEKEQLHPAEQLHTLR
jgi:hypothetical protein